MAVLPRSQFSFGRSFRCVIEDVFRFSVPSLRTIEIVAASHIPCISDCDSKVYDLRALMHFLFIIRLCVQNVLMRYRIKHNEGVLERA